MYKRTTVEKYEYAVVVNVTNGKFFTSSWTWNKKRSKAYRFLIGPKSEAYSTNIEHLKWLLKDLSKKFKRLAIQKFTVEDVRIIKQSKLSKPAKSI
jgi:hypothetical protein